LNANIRRLGLFFIIAFVIIVGDVTYWQVIDASSITSRPDNPRLSLQASHVRRGLILDRNGTILANRTVGANGIVQRTYSDPSLSEVIGYDSPRYGKSELEQTYDGYLSGSVLGTNWTSLINQWEHKQVVGDNLTLTIDDKLQREVAALLPNQPSAAVVSDPSTGQILAMVSNPGFDANQVSQPAYWQSLLQSSGLPLINRATAGYYPPGSTFKTVTLSGAIESGLVNLQTMFYGTDATGPLTVGGHTFPAAINNLAECYQSAPVSLTTAFACSDNIVYAEIGLKLGTDRFLQYTHAFGLDQHLPFDIPTSESHVRNPGGPFQSVDLASAAFGQGQLHVTPLQMNLVADAIANNGVIEAPYLVQRVTAPDGTVVKTTNPTPLYHPISAATAAQVKAAMENVVQTGSGYADKDLGIPVAGKTGTAEPGDGGAPHAWFIAFAPADHPKIAVTVIVEHAGEGAVVAAPIACRIIKAALNPPGTCP
jgi:peptidoglycan glycosyltransferase